MSSIEKTERYSELLHICLNQLIEKIGRIQIGTKEQFPYGWRKAAKGRTVWRILEEAITQNLEKHYEDLGLSKVIPSSSEVSVYDCQLFFKDYEQDVYINIKSAVKRSRVNKDDISKAVGLSNFYQEDINRELFIATFVIDFQEDMRIKLEQCIVMPITWLPDVYINPSNNANLQSSKYKDLASAKKRTNHEFVAELMGGMSVAKKKREKKAEKAIEVIEEIIRDEEGNT